MWHGPYRTLMMGLAGGVLMATAVGCLEKGGASLTEKLGMKKSQPAKTEGKTAETPQAQAEQPAPAETAEEATHIEMTIDGQHVGKDVGRTGYGQFEIAKPVSVAPTLQFSYTDKGYFGKVSSTIINLWKVNPQGEAQQCEFIVAPADNRPESAMKPDTDYNLGAPPDTLKVMDVNGQPVKGVQLQPATKYKLVFVVSGDKSETINVAFTTK